MIIPDSNPQLMRMKSQWCMPEVIQKKVPFLIRRYIGVVIAEKN